MSDAEEWCRATVGTKAVQDWLSRRADTRLGRLSLQWFRAYFEASRNSGCAATVYSSLSVLPAALVAVGVLPLVGERHERVCGASDHPPEAERGHRQPRSGHVRQRIIECSCGDHHGRHQLPHLGHRNRPDLPGRLRPRLADQGRIGGRPGAVRDLLLRPHRRHRARSRLRRGARAAGWFVVLPVWLVGSTVFWLWVPRFLLHRKISLRALLPGALLATIVLGGATATAPFFVAAPLNANGKAFGSFGVVVTMIGYVFIMVTMSLVCAVFSPGLGQLARDREATPRRSHHRSEEPPSLLSREPRTGAHERVD